MKIAVIFPGIGYHTDKPLLYYGKKIAKENGFEILEVPYGNFSKNIKGSEEKMQEAFHSAEQQAEKILDNVNFEKYQQILFISKSIGTAVAASYASKHELQVRHIYYTPVKESFLVMKSYGEQQGIVFHGTADSWADTKDVKSGCHEKNLPLYMIEDGNHSLELGNVMTDLENLLEVMKKTEEFIKE